MDIKFPSTFRMARFHEKTEFGGNYTLWSSYTEPLTMTELLDMADDDTKVSFVIIFIFVFNVIVKII